MAQCPKQSRDSINACWHQAEHGRHLVSKDVCLFLAWPCDHTLVLIHLGISLQCVGNQLSGSKSFPSGQNVNRTLNSKVTVLSTNKDFKSEPKACSMKAFVKNLWKRTSRLPSWARSQRIIRPDPQGCCTHLAGAASRRAQGGPGECPDGGPVLRA